MTANLNKLRMERDLLLNESDWVVTKHLEANEAVPTSWKKYRQDLRDITKTFKSMNDKNFKFPEKPTS
tara:strand:- start:155 stop:358 length:204 start_codon:yes stop_codon:yes gene_type:complete